MTAVEGVRAKRFPTDAERADMLKSVDELVFLKCKPFMRVAGGVSHDIARNRDDSGFKDAVQACRLMLWQVSGKFDLDGRAGWFTFAYKAVTHALARHREEFSKSTLRGRAYHLEDSFGWAAVTDPHAADVPEHDADGDFDPDELDTVERSLSAVHHAMFAPMLEVLTPAQQRLVEMVVFQRLTLPRVADQLGQKLDVVEKNFRGVLTRLHAKGLLTDEMASAYKVTIRKTTPQREWQAGEKDRFLAAVQTGRTAADVAEAFNVTVARVRNTRRNIAAILARHARAEAPYAKREGLTSWPADEQERYHAVIRSDRPNQDIADEFRVDYRRVNAARKALSARGVAAVEPCPA